MLRRAVIEGGCDIFSAALSNVLIRSKLLPARIRRDKLWPVAAFARLRLLCRGKILGQRFLLRLRLLNSHSKMQRHLPAGDQRPN